MERVFISYVRDNQTIVDNLCSLLKGNNIPYWLDREQIDAGKFWKDAIRNAIKKGSIFIACFSNESVNRIQSVMNEELNLAIDIFRQKQFDSGWLIPLKLNKCEIPAMDLGGGRYFSDIQYIDLTSDFNKGVDRLVDYLKNKFNIIDNGNKDENNSRMEDIYSQYKAYKALIDNGNGDYFHNSDMGHPVYLAGAYGKHDEYWKYADSENKNYLFKKLIALSKELKNSGIEDHHFTWWYNFTDWKSFCKYVIKVYNSKMGYNDSSEFK